MPAEHGEVLLGRRELVHRDRHQVVVHVEVHVLVEVVADAGAVGEQLLDGHVVVDQREVLAEQRASGRREVERAVLDEAHDRERGEALRPARDPESGVDLFGIPWPRCGEAVGLRDD